MHGIQQGSVNATLLLSPPHPASVSLSIKRGKTLAQRLGRSNGPQLDREAGLDQEGMVKDRKAEKSK